VEARDVVPRLNRATIFTKDLFLSDLVRFFDHALLLVLGSDFILCKFHVLFIMLLLNICIIRPLLVIIRLVSWWTLMIRSCRWSVSIVKDYFIILRIFVFFIIFFFFTQLLSLGSTLIFEEIIIANL
jgi:hypothetical protein